MRGDVRLAEVAAFEQRRLPRGAGERVAEQVTEIQSCSVTPLAEAAPGDARSFGLFCRATTDRSRRYRRHK
jgi:hypothetical protein